MTDTSLYLMTGITSGLGLKAAEHLAANKGTHIVTGVRSEAARKSLAKALPQGSYTALDLDQASTESVSRFADAVRSEFGNQTITSMVLNAGLQITSGLEKADDGIEKTFAVNHLSHWLIHDLLKDKLNEHSRVVLTASGTHDPSDPVASKFGFRGGIFPSASIVAEGKIDTSAKDDQQCLDRYATSKLCNIMMMLHYAKTGGSDASTIVAFDPGLMPGTNLARDRGLVERFAWNNVLPLLARFMAGVSSAERSGLMLAKIASGEHAVHSGEYVEFSGRRMEPSILAKSEELQIDLEDWSRTYAKQHVVTWTATTSL